MPLAHLLGGFRDKVPAYDSNSLQTFKSIDELQQTASVLVKKGFRALKMRMGEGVSHKDNLERFKAVRTAVGEDVDIMVEGHWSWTVSDDIRIGRALEPYKPYWLADPIGIHQGDI